MKKILCISLALLLVLSLCCGCGSNLAMDYAQPKVEPMETGAYNQDALYRTEDNVMSSQGAMAPEESTSATTNRKLIRTLSLHVETENYNDFLYWIENHVSLCGGYIENMEANTRYSSTNRYANLTIRVPADMLDEFATSVGEASNIVYRSESSKDITSTYIDTQSRRDALQTEHDRLLELLKQAQTLDEILQIESRLTEVRYQLQNIESQLRSYDNLVDYATINLDISEVKVYTVAEDEQGYWEKLGDGFMNSLRGVGKLIKGIFSAFVLTLPYQILIGILLAIVLSLIFIRRRKKRNSNNTPPSP